MKKKNKSYLIDFLTVLQDRNSKIENQRKDELMLVEENIKNRLNSHAQSEYGDAISSLGSKGYTDKLFLQNILSGKRVVLNGEGTKLRENVINAMIDSFRERIPNIEIIAFMILNYDKLTLQIDKKGMLHNFSILWKPNKNSAFTPKTFGILKRHLLIHYYEAFTMNRLDPKLPENTQIFYYDDLLITKDSLISFLKSREQYNDQINLPSTLLSILNDFTVLDELFVFSSENFRRNIFKGDRGDTDYSQFREQCIDNIMSILFESGSQFYVSKMQTSSASTDALSKEYKTTYVIDNIENKTIMTSDIKKENVIDIADPDGFYGTYSKKDDSELDRMSSFNTNNANNFNTSSNVQSELSNSSILYSQTKRKRKEKYISFEDFKTIVSTKSNFDERSYVILDVNLIPSSDAKSIVNCKTRKSRIRKRLSEIFMQQLRRVNLFTRKVKNDLKTRRMTRKIKSK